jgi:beta-glucanase (GH16 family)
MEHLTRWGPHRYNIAMHWDGYQKQHKQTGNQFNYVQADQDGFLTAGLLWVPGAAVYFCNGLEVARWEDPRISNVPSDIMFTLPCGGWDNDHLDDAALPADFVIKYVRVWQRRDLASAADSTRIH